MLGPPTQQDEVEGIVIECLAQLGGPFQRGVSRLGADDRAHGSERTEVHETSGRRPLRRSPPSWPGAGASASRRSTEMDVDVDHHINAASRTVGARTLETGEARVVTISRTYDEP